MSSTTSSPLLPLDIIFIIIESLAPENPLAIIPPSHEITKTLISLTTVCKGTSSLASRLLRQHCVYIDSYIRAVDFLRILKTWSPEDYPTRMYMAPYPMMEEEEVFNLPEPKPEEKEEKKRGGGEEEEEHDSDDSDDGIVYSPLQDVSLAITIRETFKLVAPSLKGLIIDMPLRTLYPEDDELKVRKILRDAFIPLVNLEEFVSVRDELYLDADDTGEPPVWPNWPKLRRLSLYNVDLSIPGSFARSMARCPNLEMTVFPRPDTVVYEEGNIKTGWLETLREAQEPEYASYYAGRPIHPGPITFTFVDSPCCFFTFGKVEHQLGTDLENRIRVRTLGISTEMLSTCQLPRGLTMKDLDARQCCHVWIRTKALKGTLWDEAEEKSAEYTASD